MRVANKRKHTPSIHDVYVGRPSPFGNLFSHKPSTFPDVVLMASRNEAITAYEQWVGAELAAGNEALDTAFRALTAESVLVCWCAPKRCHADVIMATWERWYK